MNLLRIALFSVDPPGLTLFRAFDPESFSIIPVINDGLVYIDEEGEVQPALATAWSAIGPCTLELTLRDGVRFHNGEPFDADAVVASFEAHYVPTPSAAAQGVLSTINRIEKRSRLCVRIETAMPDAMLLRRLFFFSIYPRGVLERDGRDVLETHPVGTGAYRLLRYERGRELVLERNREHWAQAATVDVLRLPILRQKEWVHRLATGEIDVALNLDSHDCMRAQRLAGVRGASREAAIAQWFLLNNHGPLADVRVRRALNHALNRRILVDLTEHGLGAAQRGTASRQTEGYVELEPYRYSPELARRLLQEAGYERGFTLRGMVSESSTALYFAVREFLSRVDVTLEADIVPRATWMHTVVGGAMQGQRFGGDFAVTCCDNPLLHALFLQHFFFFSGAMGSLTRDPAFDALLVSAATAVDDPLPALARLERYHRDQALMLFTVQQHVHAAWREGVELVLPRSGHFDAVSFWKLRIVEGRALERRSLPTLPEPPHEDLSTLLDATSHTGAFYLSSGARLEEPTVRRIWTNLTESEQRWRVQNEPMLRELVSSIEARTNLANVLSSTDRVAIVGHSPEGRRLFHNRGYELMFGAANERSVLDFLGDEGAHGWPAIREVVEREGAWLGPVHFARTGRPPGAPEKLFLTVSPARDEDGATIGHTFVFSDFSGEEERIKTAATRTILENVPYGLFMVDCAGRMMSGYSDACRGMFPGVGSADLVGRDLTALLALDARRAEQFRAAYAQVVDDVLPPEVTLGQLPQRLTMGARTFSLRGSLVHGEEGQVAGVLFTMLDISPLVTAEREAEHHRATVMIMRFRDAFEPFARELDDELSRLAKGAASAEPAIRALLHTAKGVLAQFALTELAEHIHALEDRPHLDAGALAALQASLRATLKSHGLDLTACEPVYCASESFLQQLEARILAAGDLATLRDAVREGLERLREKRAGDLLGPVAEAAQQLAARRDKRVRVQIRGADQRVPAHHGAVLGKLVHLVRNAIDHGLETEDERGDKDPIGTLAISVSREATSLLVTVSDDGRGIDGERLVAKAVAQNLLTPGEAQRLDARARLRLVFLSGLSTAEQVTDVSGRGIGVAATQAEVEARGGQIEVESAPGRGTTFTLRLPL